MRQVLILDEIEEAGITALRARSDIKVVIGAAMKEAELIAKIKGVSGLMVRSATKVTRAVIEAADALEAIGRAGVGVDNIDMAAATARKLPVFNSPAGNVNAAAEMTIALMLTLARKVHLGDAGLRRGVWDRKRLQGTELAGKTLGIIGIGQVGRIVARIARAFGMELVAYDPPAAGDAFREVQARQAVELKDLLAVSDWVTLHVPLIDATRGMIGARELELMKPSACLINCARGAVVDERALYDALVARKIAGAALDVFAVEPCTDSPLFALENVVATPHLGATSAEAQLNVAIDASNAMLDYFKSGDASKAVNARQLKGS